MESKVMMPLLGKFTFVNLTAKISEEKPYTLLFFFATYCPPCHGEIPKIAKLTTDFAHELNIIAVSKEKIEAMENFFKKNVVIRKCNVALDTSNLMDSLITIQGENKVPHAFIFSSSTKELVWHGHPSSINDILIELLD